MLDADTWYTLDKRVMVFLTCSGIGQFLVGTTAPVDGLIPWQVPCLRWDYLVWIVVIQLFLRL